ncbi:nitrogenase iron-molybdenum cofactor biosynthesis protein NifE [Clostridium sp. 19966]|uniref:nitrogenase iron-molybdenum cofactor biosynthesis protein NifE n=1 Tax=Clostridium sp. 19966 TaxID=2768166 RepID=UPI0028DE8BF9|nr:nitrogenase iron-molybdenum cofactor biosynthesis protein NifE [Clostridium sp. 19966]MDT8717426.1 nitrogenase iron-molybdenum cofactor biosynthesis protein NifE [Clostridium sp. 19966]
MAISDIDVLIEEREKSIFCNHKNKKDNFECDKESVSGTVSQRACVYCGARVVLNPITDAYHIVHGPIGCASYTWDIRGSLSSGEEIYRNSFSTDLRETDVIFGGEKKLTKAIAEIAEKFKPPIIFIYCTCIVGVIGDDVDEVCRQAEKKFGIRVIPVKSPGFAGHKSMGYKAACNALINLMGDKKENLEVSNQSKGITVNYLGDFNLSGEVWIIKNYLKAIGVDVTATITGDAKYEDLIKAPEASLNIVQCAGSMTYLAKKMEANYNIPFLKTSFFGLEDTRESLFAIANFFQDEEIMKKAKELVKKNEEVINEELNYYRKRLKGKKAAIYVGGGFKAISLIKQFRDLGMETVLVGTQTGKKEDYDVIRNITVEGTIILDDTNPYELEKFMKKTKADILVGGVKERPLAYKLAVAFCDHNHERKHPLCGFIGAINFAKEVDLSVNSNVWNIIKKERGELYE